MAELVSIKRNVDVSPGQAAPAVFHCSQGDVGSKLILGLLNNGTAYSIPSGVTVTIEGSESNGSIFTPISATASGSDITFYLTGEMTAVAGPAICQAVLKSGSNILGTANFTLEVESSPMGADAPPVFTDAGWTWMLQKLTTEIVPALGDNIVDAIESKADQSDLTALSNTVAGHTGSITVLNNTVNTLNQSVTENRQNIATKLDKNQGAANAGKYLKVGTDGNVENAELDVTTDKTLSIADKAADAKAVGDELDDLKADIKKIKPGLSAEAKEALLACFAKVAWIDENGQNYYDALYNALYSTATSYSVTYNLTNCKSSNTSMATQEENAYSTTITPNDGFTLLNAAVSVTMGGIDITTTAYNNGAINIPSVTGDITISISAVFNATLWLAGLGTPGTSLSSPQYAPFYLPSSKYTYDYAKKIVAIELSVSQIGALSVGVSNDDSHLVGDERYDSSYDTIYETFDVETAGVQLIVFSEPLQLNSGQCLFVGARSDTATFRYNGTGETGFISVVNDKYRDDTRSLGVNVYVA